MRLAISHAALVLICGLVLVGLVYAFMRFVPGYQVVPALPVQGATTVPVLPGANVPAVPTTTTAEITSRGDFLRVLLVASALGLLVLAVFAAILSWLVAGRIVRPLAEINDAASRAARGGLEHRLDLSGPDDELRALGRTFNHMLVSLESSFAGQQRFAANASHELLTPLATTQTIIDVQLAKPAVDANELRTSLRRVGKLNRENIETVNALLDLADAGSAPLGTEIVDLVALANDIRVDLAAEAAERAIEFHPVQGAAHVEADRVLIRQALSNLFRNAIRHNQPNGSVWVTAFENPDEAGVEVGNTGPVVSDELLATAHEPFKRGAGRTARGTGRGLGLTIAAAVVEAHSGRLQLASRSTGGLDVMMTLPRDTR